MQITLLSLIFSVYIYFPGSFLSTIPHFHHCNTEFNSICFRISQNIIFYCCFFVFFIVVFIYLKPVYQRGTMIHYACARNAFLLLNSSQKKGKNMQFQSVRITSIFFIFSLSLLCISLGKILISNEILLDRYTHISTFMNSQQNI